MGDNKLRLLEQNLYQYFYVFGMDHQTAFDDHLYRQIKDQKKKIDFVQPRTISKFPQFSHSYSIIADEIIMKHIFPKGFFIEYIDTPPTTYQDFYFTLDNYPFIEHGLKMHYTVILFYESLEDYHQIKLAYDNFDNNSKDESTSKELQLNSPDNHYKDYYAPKAICLASLLPFPTETKKILLSLYYSYAVNKGSSEQIEKIIERLVLSLPYPPRGQHFFKHKIFNEDITFSQTAINKIPNSSINLAIIFSKIKVEDIIKIYKCLLLELPLLIFSSKINDLSPVCEGLLSLLYPFRYQWPNVAILPMNNYSLISLCDCFFFGINEKYSPNFFDNYAIEKETKTIYCVDLETKTIHQLKPTQLESCNIILGQNGDPFFETRNIYDQIEMPIHYKKKFHNRLSATIQTIKTKSQTHEPILFNVNIREEFFYFLVSLLNDYAKYLKKTQISWKQFQIKETENIDSIYNVNEYINSFSVEQPFYKRLLNTKIFKEFIVRKMNPKTIDDKIEMLFFDEKIIQKKNKHFFAKTNKTPLLESKAYDNLSTIIISKNQKFTNSELLYLCQSENQRNALKYYQQINVQQDNTTIEIKTLVFPKLLYDNDYFKKSYIDIYKSNNLPFGYNYKKLSDDQFQDILTQDIYHEIYKDYGYNPMKYKRSIIFTNEDYVEMSWLIMLTLSFWYCDEQEKEEKFLDILKMIKTWANKKDNIIIFAYYSILKYGTNSQKIRFFEEIIQFTSLTTYSTYAALCSSLSVEFNTKMTKPCNYTNITLLQREYSKEKEQSDMSEDGGSSIQEFYRMRSLCNSKNNDNSETISFENNCICSNCGEKIVVFNKENLKDKQVIENIKFTCTNDSYKEIALKIAVEYNDDKYEMFNVLHPKVLFENIYQNFMTLNNLKIDIETFKKNHHDLFWNCILQFNLQQLSFDFLIPYSKETVYSNMNASENNTFTDLEISSTNETYEFIVQ